MPSLIKSTVDRKISDFMLKLVEVLPLKKSLKTSLNVQTVVCNEWRGKLCERDAVFGIFVYRFAPFCVTSNYLTTDLKRNEKKNREELRRGLRRLLMNVVRGNLRLILEVWDD
jgi:hypothetical protein